MADWRQDLSVIREIITQTPSNRSGWRGDLIGIARYLGGNPKSWREAVSIWAEYNGITERGWRKSIIELSRLLVPDVRPNNWREAFQFTRRYYEGNPPEPPNLPDFVRLVDRNGLPLYDSEMKQLYVKQEIL